MATNLSVESPDFDEIRKERGIITSNAVKLLWEVLNYEIGQRRIGVRTAKQLLQGRAVADATTASENNLDLEGALVWWYNTSSSVNLTGIRNGAEGRVIFLHNVGSGTISILHASASSDAANRFVNEGSATVSLTTNKSAIYMYINARWRELR